MSDRLTDEEKWGIIAAWKKHGSIAAVVRQGTYNMKRVKYWVDRYKQSGDVNVRKGSGRKRAINIAAARAAVDLLVDSERFGTSQLVAEELHRQGLTTGSKPLHRTTVARAAVAQSIADGDKLEVAQGEPPKELTQDTKKKRLAFCKDHLGTNWGNVMFTDRKKFSFRYPGTKHKGKRWIKESNGGKRGHKCFRPNNPQRVNIYMGINKWGVSKVHKVTGSTGMQSEFKNQKGQPARNITSAEYAQVLKKTFLPEGTRMFNQQGLSSWVLQQDNDPTHKKPAAAEIAAWNAAHPTSPVTLLPVWPPNSPDLSPIENVWGIVQRQVDAMGCKSFKEFETAVIDKLQHFDKQVLARLYKSMSKRIQLCIAANGDKTKY
jgi:DDE superfamily endonuclease